MPAVKIPRKSTLVDMTAMCDVAFLLLTFFILTSKFRPQEPVQINMPGSRAERKIAEQNIMMLTVSKDGKLFFGVDNQKVRARMLERMMAAYPDVAFTEAQKLKFTTTESFGVPFQMLPALLDGAIKNDESAPGIPVDSTASRYRRNELADWIFAGRVADNELRQLGEIQSEGIAVAVKGDGSTDYPKIKKVMDTLVEKKVNKFNLVTSLKGGDSVASGE
ncbi:MAG: biopolymer transporter ExbD [Saprospiraceae bacterium]|nr:biopolymer transporter ExbD [Saprospiraceae bacterium]